jgi:hypothetical protein
MHANSSLRDSGALIVNELFNWLSLDVLTSVKSSTKQSFCRFR